MVHVVDLYVREGALHELVEGFPGLVEGGVHELLEHRRQLGEALEGRLRPGEFLVVQGQGAVFVVDGHHGAGEAVLGDGRLGALLAFIGQAVHVFPADAFQGRDKVRADALVPLGLEVPKGHVARVHEAAPGEGRGVGHHFRAPGDHAVFHTRHDAGGGEVHGGNAGAAEAIEGDAAGGGVPAGEEEGHAAQARGLLALLGACAPDHVVHLGGV